MRGYHRSGIVKQKNKMTGGRKGMKEARRKDSSLWVKRFDDEVIKTLVCHRDLVRTKALTVKCGSGQYGIFLAG